MTTNSPNRDLEFRKFEYEFVNQKLNLNVSRLDKLWIALGGSVFVLVGLALKTEGLRVIFVFLPFIVSLWLALFLYVIGQVERQKMIVMNHAKEINRLLGKDLLLYDLGMMRNLWRFDKRRPSAYIMLLCVVLVFPTLAVFLFTIIKAYWVIYGELGRVAAWLYVVVSVTILASGVISYFWGRFKRKHYQIESDASQENRSETEQ